MGWLWKRDFYELARFYKKDETRPRPRLNEPNRVFVTKCDCYTVFFNQLRGFK
jgi:hypothetical protein